MLITFDYNVALMKIRKLILVVAVLLLPAPCPGQETPITIRAGTLFDGKGHVQHEDQAQAARPALQKRMGFRESPSNGKKQCRAKQSDKTCIDP